MSDLRLPVGTVIKPLALFFAVVAAGIAAAAESKPNVLFIVADDQRTNLGCYGDNIAITPNIDRLAAEGARFERAYCQYPMCGPSRASLLTGLRPDAVQVYDLHTTVRKYNPNILTLPQDFKNHGYFTRAIGKVYHPEIDDPESWSVATFPGPEIVGTTSITSGTVGGLPDVTPGPTGGKRGPSWFAPDLPEDQFHDGVIANQAIEALNELKDRPFFLAVGFNRPHLPFVAPKKYFDLYENVEFPLAENNFPPAEVPENAMTQSGELRQYRDIPATGPLSMEKSRELLKAFYACTSFMDAQVGRLLNELKELGLDDNTIVVFWGDHGYHLGEHGIWAKHTNFEVATRAPLIFRMPGGGRGIHIKSIVEFVDVYPTLAALCGWNPKGLHGESLADYLAGSRDDSITSISGIALSQVNRNGAVGYSLRTDHYRYTEWRRRKDNSIVARELYDHNTDPSENQNVASKPQNDEVLKSLHQKLEILLTGS